MKVKTVQVAAGLHCLESDLLFHALSCLLGCVWKQNKEFGVTGSNAVILRGKEWVKLFQHFIGISYYWVKWGKKVRKRKGKEFMKYQFF